jgi:hypothetical protein
MNKNSVEDATNVFLGFAQKWAAEVFAGIGNEEYDGTEKTKLEQIDDCQNCERWDYRRNDDGNTYPPCECGCAWKDHAKTGEDRWFGVLVTYASKVLELNNE